GRRGVPLLGLIPIFGRLFATPTKSDDNSDIVITVTPRVLRAPTITPEDLEMRDSGTLSSPASQSLEALVIEADREDQLASARQLPTNASVQLPTPLPNLIDPEPPTFVPAPAALTTTASTNTSANTNMTAANMTTTGNTSAPGTTQPADNRTPPSSTRFAPAALTTGASRDISLIVPTLNTNAPQAAPAMLRNQPATVPKVENRIASDVPVEPSEQAASTGAALLLVSYQPEMSVWPKQRLLILV